MIHLADDVRNFGSLNNVSAFPFENFMRMIKSAIRKPQLILQQLGNRVDEGFFHCKQKEKPCTVYKEHSCGPVVGNLIRCQQYKN